MSRFITSILVRPPTSSHVSRHWGSSLEDFQAEVQCWSRIAYYEPGSVYQPTGYVAGPFSDGALYADSETAVNILATSGLDALRPMERRVRLSQTYQEALRLGAAKAMANEHTALAEILQVGADAALELRKPLLWPKP